MPNKWRISALILVGTAVRALVVGASKLYGNPAGATGTLPSPAPESQTPACVIRYSAQAKATLQCHPVQSTTTKHPGAPTGPAPELQ